jgi:excisionase family DNA binding protein
METRSITLNPREVATMLGISYWQVLNMCKKNELPHIVIGKRKFFRLETIQQWLAKLEEKSITLNVE